MKGIQHVKDVEAYLKSDKLTQEIQDLLFTEKTKWNGRVLPIIQAKHDDECISLFESGVYGPGPVALL